MTSSICPTCRGACNLVTHIEGATRYEDCPICHGTGTVSKPIESDSVTPPERVVNAIEAADKKLEPIRQWFNTSADLKGESDAKNT